MEPPMLSTDFFSEAPMEVDAVGEPQGVVAAGVLHGVEAVSEVTTMSSIASRTCNPGTHSMETLVYTPAIWNRQMLKPEAKSRLVQGYALIMQNYGGPKL